MATTAVTLNPDVSYIYSRIQYDITPNSSNNTSTVNAYFQVKSTGSVNSQGDARFAVWIKNSAGTKVATATRTSNTTIINDNTWRTYATATYTFTHDIQTGQLSFKVGGGVSSGTDPLIGSSWNSLPSADSASLSGTDFQILAVAPTISYVKIGKTISITWSTPTAATGGTQTFTSYISKNGGSYTQAESVVVESTDYINAYVVASIDGSTAQSSTLSLPGVPFAPAAPTISNVVTTNLTLSWTAPGTNGSAITSYIIQATTDDGTTWSDLYTGITQTSKDITGLTIAATYKFRIIAVSSAGNSPYGSASASQFISAYGYRYTSPTNKVAVAMAARYTGNSGDSVVVDGTTYTGWKMLNSIKRYTSTGWIDLQS